MGVVCSINSAVHAGPGDRQESSNMKCNVNERLTRWGRSTRWTGSGRGGVNNKKTFLTDCGSRVHGNPPRTTYLHTHTHLGSGTYTCVELINSIRTGAAGSDAYLRSRIIFGSTLINETNQWSERPSVRLFVFFHHHSSNNTCQLIKYIQYVCVCIYKYVRFIIGTNGKRRDAPIYKMYNIHIY